MPVVRYRSEMTTRQGAGGPRRSARAGRLRRAGRDAGPPFTLTPAAAMPPVTVEAQEAMVYVAAGSGTAQVGAEQYPLERESMLWLSPATEIVLTARLRSGMHAGPVGVAQSRPAESGEAQGHRATG